jgi:hypothetical protein
MSGFNRINNIQPVRTIMAPLGVRSNNQNNINNNQHHQMAHHQQNIAHPQQLAQQHQAVRRQSLSTPSKHANQIGMSATPVKRMNQNESSVTPAKRHQLSHPIETISVMNGFGFTTPANLRANPLAVQNAPIKKRSVDPSRMSAPQDASFTDGVIIESQSIIRDEQQSQEMDEEEELGIEVGDEDDDDYQFPANQQGLYGGGYGTYGSPTPPKDSTTQEGACAKGKVAFERVKEETVEMGGFVLPGADKKTFHKSYNWIAGRSDGQYRVVLGYNTLFKQKSKNGIDVSTGENNSTRWRVVRFENRYKENYPYTEFPAKYLTPIIKALQKAQETHDDELKEEATV